MTSKAWPGGIVEGCEVLEGVIADSTGYRKTKSEA